jgi:hypothetical protein
MAAEGYEINIPASGLAQRDHNDRPSCSSDDGYPSAVGYCPINIAKRINPQYKVPDLGLDHDIKSSIANEKEAEKSTGHTWTPT